MRAFTFIFTVILSIICSTSAFGAGYSHDVFAAGTVAQQNIHFSNNPNFGNFNLRFGYIGVATQLSYDISNSQLQTKIRTISGLGSSTVSGSVASGDFTVVFTGYSGPASLLSVENNSLTIYGQQTIHFSSQPSSGDYSLRYGSNTTGSLAASADATAVQTALRALSSLSSVTVTGANSTDFTVAFKGIVGAPTLLTAPTNTTGKTITISAPVSGDATTVTTASSVDGTLSTIPLTNYWAEIVPSLEYGVSQVSVYNPNSTPLILGYGPVGSETGVAVIFPNMAFQYGAVLQAGSRIAVKSASSDLSAGNYLDINFVRQY